MKKFFIIFLFLLGFSGLFYSAFQSNFVQQNRFYKAYKYERWARKFPPGSEMSLRCKAIADAYRHNKKTYSYETSSPSFMKPLQTQIQQK